MPIVDERGRVFGRLNLFDAIVLVLAVWMIPLAYGGYLLLRTPMPTLTSVEPTMIVYGENMKFKVRGTNLVPYLRVSIGRNQGRTFKFTDTTEAEVDLFDTPPGVYDVVLYDNAQERARIPRGLTIAPSALPDAKLVLVGTFGNLTAAVASELKAGMAIPDLGVIERVGQVVPQRQRVFVRPNMVEIPAADARMVPAVLKLSCFVRSNQGQPECVGGEVSLQPTSLLFFKLPVGTLPFQVDEVRSIEPLQPVRVTVRFSGDARVLGLMKAGDVGHGDVLNELAAGAAIDSISAGGTSREARLTVQAQHGGAGWLYANAPLRAGSSFAMRTATYEVQGTVIAVDREPSAP